MLSIRFDMPLWLMGIYGGIMAICVVLLRILLGKRLPKRLFPILWSVVLVRLFIPFSISSPFSLHIPLLGEMDGRLFGSISILQQQTTETYEAASDSSIEELSLLLNSANETEQTYTSPATAESAPSFPFISISWVGTLWAAGVIASAVWLALCWSKCQKVLENSASISNQTAEKVLQKCRITADVYTCDRISSPLAVGLGHPGIYLPTRMDFSNYEMLTHIIAHEAMHIKYRDNWLKTVMLAALCLHWYNPLIWWMARELSRDLESACDEATLSVLEGDNRKNYAYSLMAMAALECRGSLIYSSFSKTEVERRIKGVMAYKRAGKFLISLTIMLAIGTSAVFATGGTTFYSSGLCWGIQADGCYMIADVVLNRDLELGEFAQGRANSTVYRVLAESAGQEKGRTQLQKEIVGALSREFGVEPGAFQAHCYLSIPREVILEQYAQAGITIKGDRYYYDGTLVHSITDREEGNASYITASSWQDGGVDLYILRDETGRIKEDGVQAYLWYRF